MSIKGLFFLLFLYVSLVWVGAFYFNPGPNTAVKIRQTGLFWTASGLLVVLAWLVVARLFAWWRMWRSKAAVSKPAIAKKPESAINEDEAALTALIAEATASLAKSPAYLGVEKTLSGLPIYLLVGPENSGKTSTFVNSGLAPQLLAGQLAGQGPLASTRVANIWLVQNAVFVEIAGRFFSGDPGRWTQLLTVLRGKTTAPTWRRMWGERDDRTHLNGVIAFCEVSNFTGALNPDRLARDSRLWQERLGAVGDVFGVEFPVYQVVTKCDSVLYFDDYFRRLPEIEVKQVLGCTLEASAGGDLRTGQTFADVEGKRLSRTFNALFDALAERRIVHLAHEPEMSRRPAIYEFPRELKRIRPAFVQFLSEAFRPHPLRPGPVLRGYYLTGVREVEALAAEVGATRTDWVVPDGIRDATRLFRADATQMFRPDDPKGSKGIRTGTTTRSWMFSSDLFQNIVLRDRPARKVAKVDTRAERYRRMTLAGVCALCALLCFAWTWSFFENRKLLNDIGAVTNIDIRKSGGGVTLGDLRALDSLRLQTGRLVEYDRGGAPWGLRWGLYTGDRLARPARAAYFRGFQQLILNDLNSALTGSLERIPTNRSGDDKYQPVYRALATHMMISSAACKADPALVAQVLKQTAEQTAPASADRADRNDLIARQIDFYASELRYANPCRIPEDAVARDRARQYLANVQGLERIYANLLASAQKSLTTSSKLSDLAPNYRSVLSGPAEVNGAFTRDGWAFMEKASKEGRAGDSGDACVVGNPGSAKTAAAGGDIASAIQRRFIQDYIQRWRAFVSGLSVTRFSGAEDAANRLEILAGHQSPLLALFALTAKQTNFPATPEQAGPVEKAQEKFAKAIGFGKDDKPVDAQALTGTPVDITRTFQPVHTVVPPGSDTWVLDKNAAYVDALATLGRSMREIARAGTDPAVHQAAGQAYEKALDSVRQLARSFKPVGVEGLDGSVQRLLEEPIRNAKPYIISDPDKAVVAKINGELKTTCATMAGTLRKYPFSHSGPDATLQDLAAVFAPASGLIWKFQTQSLADLVVKEGTQWKAKDPAKKPGVTPEILALLNRAQAVTDVFYPAGATQPQLTYVLRPKLDVKDSVLELELDGNLHQWNLNLQKQFRWPGQPAAGKELGAVMRMQVGQVKFPVASQGGLWGIFKIMGDAEPRPLLSKTVEWKYFRSGGGRLEPLQPPVRVEIVEFPGGVDVFNPRFFDGLGCPARAVQ